MGFLRRKGAPRAQEPKKDRSLRAAAPLTSGAKFAQGERGVPDLIAPGQVEVFRDHFVMDDAYCRVFVVTDWPRFTDYRWLERFFRVSAAYDISFHFEPLPRDRSIRDLNKALVALQVAELGRGTRLASAKHIQQDHDFSQLRLRLQSGEEKLLSVLVVYTVRAHSRAELETSSAQLRQALREVDLNVRPLYFDQLTGFTACLPFGRPDPDLPRRNVPTAPLATVFPFNDAPFESITGTYYGDDLINARPVIYDRFAGKNYNAVVLGTSGGGKTYAMKSEIFQQLLAGSRVVVIDPDNEYGALAEAVGGEVVHIGPSSKDHINPMDIARTEQAEDDADFKDSLTAKIDFLKALIDVMTSDISDKQVRSSLRPLHRSVLDEALYAVYAARGITTDEATHGGRKPPFLRELVEYLKNYGNQEGEAAGGSLSSSAAHAQELAGMLHEYADGSYARFFNEKTTVDFANRFIVFDISATPVPLRPTIASIITDFVWVQARVDRHRRLFVIDELWKLIQHPQLANVVIDLYKRARKYHLGVTGITQDVADLLRSEAGDAIISNTELRIILAQKPGKPIEAIRDALAIDDEACRVIENPQKGEAIYQFGGRTIHLQGLTMPPEIHELITTNPNEVKAREARQRAGQRFGADATDAGDATGDGK